MCIEEIYEKVKGKTIRLKSCTGIVCGYVKAKTPPTLILAIVEGKHQSSWNKVNPSHDVIESNIENEGGYKYHQVITNKK